MKYTFIALSILLLGGCVSASFPGLEEKEGQFIKSDSQNAQYENIDAQPTTAVVVENTDKKSTDGTKKESKIVAEKENKVEKKEEPKKTVVATKTVEEKKPEAIKEKAEAAAEEVKPTIEVLRATLYFNDGSSVLESASKKINDVAKFAKEKNAKIKVVGHSSSRTLNTDPVSHKMANFEASLKRAQNTAKALERAGVKKSNIIIEAVSDSRPAYKEIMPEGERLNRRAEIFVIY